jgi:hypothetical protein
MTEPSFIANSLRTYSELVGEVCGALTRSRDFGNHEIDFFSLFEFSLLLQLPRPSLLTRLQRWSLLHQTPGDTGFEGEKAACLG